jgi:CheY-like chemotaxis protein
MNTMTAPTKDRHLVLGSSEEALTICVLDDEQAMVEMLQESLRCLGFSSIGTSDPQHTLDMIDKGRVRVVMSDGMDGLQFLEQALHHDPGVYVILIGFYSLDNAIATIKRGRFQRDASLLFEIMRATRCANGWTVGTRASWHEKI